MKVLIVADTYARLAKGIPSFGGLEKQVYYTAKHLRAMGVQADLVNVYYSGLSRHDIASYDIVHIFNTGGPKGALIMVQALAQEQGIPVIFTPVYWPPNALKKNLKLFGVHIIEEEIEDTIRAPLRTLISRSSAIIVNARAEWNATVEDLGIDDEGIPVYVVYNAIDLQELENVVETPFKDKEYVLCVGRIEWRKNQIGLAQALKVLAQHGRKLNLLLIGAYSGDNRLKVQLEKALNGVMAAWIGEQPPPVVLGAMRAAQVYCQPSFYETPGLAALEAAALGKPVVVGGWGSEREYFGDLVEYGRPDSPEEIADAIERAMDSPPERWQRLAAHVRTHYTYEVAAQETLKAYKCVLGH